MAEPATPVTMDVRPVVSATHLDTEPDSAAIFAAIGAACGADPSTADRYEARNDALRSIARERNLREDDVAALTAWIASANDVLRVERLAALKNDVMNLLRRQETPAPDFADTLISMFESEAHPPAIQDYCIQHLGAMQGDIADEAIRGRIRSLLVKAAGRINQPYAGTALYALAEDASATPAQDAELRRLTLALCSPAANAIARISAIQLAGQHGYAEALPLLRETLSASRRDAVTDIVCIGSLGLLGDAGDIPLLRRFAAMGPRYATAADADGNMTADGSGWHYAWNGENRMVCASNDEVIVTYAYDHRGRMVRKEFFHGSVETQRLEYVWDNWNIIRETAITNKISQLAYNVWGLDIDGSIQGVGGVGGLLSISRNVQTYYPAYDANGNVFEYVSASHGTLIAHYDYSPFGEPLGTSGNGASSFSHWFSTKPYCSITKLTEYQMRKYNSTIGRWTSRDPIEDSSGHNSRFVENRPIGGIDITGLSFCVPWGPPEVVERKTKLLAQGARHEQYKLLSYRIASAPGTMTAPIIILPYGGAIIQKSICICDCERKVLSYTISIECERKQQRIHCEFNTSCGTVSGDTYEDRGWSSRIVKRREQLGTASTVTMITSPLPFSETDDRSCDLPCFLKCNSLNTPEPSSNWNGSCESL